MAVTKNGTPYPKWNTNTFKENSSIYDYTVTVRARGHGTEGPYQIPMDEMDAILSLGKIRLLLYEEAAKHIRIEIYKDKSLVPKL